MTDPTIGQRLKQIRKDENLTQIELAEVCGSYQSVIARIENGSQDITIEITIKLCMNLGYCSDYILLGEPPRKRVKNQNNEGIYAILETLRTEIEVHNSRIRVLEKILNKDLKKMIMINTNPDK